MSAEKLAVCMRWHNSVFCSKLCKVFPRRQVSVKNKAVLANLLNNQNFSEYKAFQSVCKRCGSLIWLIYTKVVASILLKNYDTAAASFIVWDPVFLSTIFSPTGSRHPMNGPPTKTTHNSIEIKLG